MVPIKLFLVFLKISILAFGGLYSFVPLLEKELVEKNAWLTLEEFKSFFGATQIIPGAISIKFATYIGFKLSGILGVIAANIGNFIVPMSFIFLFISSYRFLNTSPIVLSAFKGISIIIIGMIFGVAWEMLKNTAFNFVHLFVAILGFIAFAFLKLDTAWIVVLGGLLGLIFFK
jgi:chromate transporter